MFRTRLYVMAFISAVVIVSAGVWTQADDMDDEANEAPFGFGIKIAGTYYSAPGLFGSGILTLHADGTMVAVSGACCGSGASDNIQSEGYGNWIRTGPYQIELSALILATEYNEVDGIPLLDGNVICEASEVLNFAPDFQSYEGHLVTACWYQDEGGIPDLLDPELREPGLCTADFPPELFDVSGERFPVRYPACGG